MRGDGQKIALGVGCWGTVLALGYIVYRLVF
jgi:hypothetical protein